MADATPRRFEPNPAPITALLRRIAAGERSAVETLFNAIYDDLHRMVPADKKKNGKFRGILHTTESVVHDACIKLLGPNGIDGPSFENRRHLYGSAARAIMQVLADYAQYGMAQGRTPPRDRIPLDEGVAVARESDVDIFESKAALARIEQLEPDLLEVVHLHAVLGLTYEQVGWVIEVGPTKAKSMYQKAIAKLREPEDGRPRA